MIKIRSFPDENYKAIFFNWQTLRLGQNIKQLKYPEFYDIAINEKCLAGCPYCYVSSMATWKNYENVVKRIYNFFSKMDDNQKPFQVAIGGHGEPTLHPDFCEVLKTFYDLWIVPNYTTNWMHLSKEILEATKKYSGGVAVSCHPHLDKIWKKAVDSYYQNKIKLNLHIIIWEPGSVERFKEIYNEFSQKVDYLVALPYSSSWRWKEVNVYPEWEKFFDYISEIGINKLAFWANFYPYLLENKIKFSWLDISLYEPEIMSWYIMFNEENPPVFRSSYCLEPR